MSSLGLWEVMLAFQKANKQKHAEDVARQQRDWKRADATRRLQLEEERIKLGWEAYRNPKARAPEQVALDEARRDKVASEADRAAVLAATEEERQIADRGYKTADRNYKAGRLALDQSMAPARTSVLTASAAAARGKERRANELHPLNMAQAGVGVAQDAVDLKQSVNAPVGGAAGVGPKSRAIVSAIEASRSEHQAQRRMAMTSLEQLNEIEPRYRKAFRDAWGRSWDEAVAFNREQFTKSNEILKLIPQQIAERERGAGATPQAKPSGAAIATPQDNMAAEVNEVVSDYVARNVEPGVAIDQMKAAGLEDAFIQAVATALFEKQGMR